MIQSEYLDFAISLAVVFFLAGMVVSGLNEGLNWLFRVRAKFLWAYLYDLFAGDRNKRALPSGLLGITKLWKRGNDRRPKNGLNVAPVQTESVGADDWLQRLGTALDPIDAPQLTKRDDHSVTSIKHVPAPSLAQSLVEIFADVGRGELTRSLRDVMARKTSETDAAAAIARLGQDLDTSGAVAAAIGTFRAALVNTGDVSGPHQDEPRQQAADALAAEFVRIASVSDNSGLRDSLRAAARKWPAGPSDDDIRPVIDGLIRLFPTEFARLRIESAIGKLDPKSPIAPTLKRLWEAGSRQIDEFRTGIEKYFNGEFTRLSGYYKRSIRLVTFSIALLVAVLGSIDTIRVGGHLWRNPDARESLRQLADGIATDTTTDPAADPPPEDPAGQSTTAALERIQAECEKDNPADDAEINTPSEAADAYGKVRNCVSGAIDELTDAGVVSHALWTDADGWADEWSDRPLLHALGLLITALALMLGAPFWFDIIKRATGLRRGLTGET